MEDVRRETDFEQYGAGETVQRRADICKPYVCESVETSDELDVHVRDTHMLPTKGNT